jgi:hypothetical protein
MRVELAVALIAGAFALLSAGATIWNMRAIERLKRDAERQSEIRRYREPLSRAAFDLQSRLFNILRRGVVGFSYSRKRARALICYRKYNLSNWSIFLLGRTSKKGNSVH